MSGARGGETTTWNPRYVAYAHAHGETPEGINARDRRLYPGGCMAGFLVWHSQQLRAFTATKPASSCFNGEWLSDEGHDAFNAWLAAQPLPSSAPAVTPERDDA